MDKIEAHISGSDPKAWGQVLKGMSLDTSLLLYTAMWMMQGPLDQDA